MNAPVSSAVMEKGRLENNQPERVRFAPNLNVIAAYLKQEIPVGTAAKDLYNDQIWEAHVPSAEDLFCHQDRVAGLVVKMARYHPDVSEEETTLGFNAAGPHDIGKLDLDLNVVFKPDKLTPDEYVYVQQHAELSSNLVRKIAPADFSARTRAYNDTHPDAPLCLLPETQETVDAIADLILEHHEHENGTGYPYGLTAEDTSPISKIMTVADVYDALTHERCYHAAMSRKEAIELMREEGHGKFDPDTIDLLETVTEPKLEAANPLAAPEDRRSPKRPTGSGAHRIPGLMLVFDS